MSSTGVTGKMSTIPPSHHDPPSRSTGSKNSGRATAMRTARATVISGWVRGPMYATRFSSMFQIGAYAGMGRSLSRMSPSRPR